MQIGTGRTWLVSRNIECRNDFCICIVCPCWENNTNAHFILSTALLHVSYSHSEEIVRYLAELGRILSNGEILQLNSISNEEISEDIYYQVIKQKTAALFEACAGIGAMSANASELQIEEAKRFGQRLDAKVRVLLLALFERGNELVHLALRLLILKRKQHARFDVH